MQDIQWWQLILIIITVLLAVVAFKFVVTFNVTDWRKNRDERLKEALKIHCPHVEIVDMNTETRTTTVKCLITKPRGTFTLYCNRCGQSFSDEGIGFELQQFYGQNPEAYINKIKKVDKIAKKLYG